MRHNTIRAAFVGAGNIARIHAEVISELPNVHLVAVSDSNDKYMNRFSSNFKITSSSFSELLSDVSIDSIHILTPPDTHGFLLKECLLSGKSIFIEKPICVTNEEFSFLESINLKENQVISVNQNMIFYPAMQELRKHVNSGKFGKVRQIDLVFRPALRQLSAKQLSHWMFRSRKNLLLEQAVHPVSQLLVLLGRPNTIRAIPTEELKINSDNSVVTGFVAAMQFGSVSVSLNFSVGASYPVWRLTAYCDDGVLEADMVANICTVQGRTPYIEPLDHALSAYNSCRKRSGTAVRNLLNYARATVGLTTRNDAFYLSMRNSITHFYGALAKQQVLVTDKQFGLDAVSVCYELDRQLHSPVVISRPVSSASEQGTLSSLTPVTVAENSTQSRQPKSVTSDKGIVCILGATGFIGRYATQRFIEQGYRVRAVARTIKNLPDIFNDSRVELIKGDVCSPVDMEHAINGSSWVVNLAHGGGGGNFEEIKTALVDSAVLVAHKAVEANVKRLVHVGSIASLYLGNSTEIITGTTEPDEHPELRGDYARAKTLADKEVETICCQGQIEYVILRPGIVVGVGSHPLHSGLGFFNNEGHVIGWSEGHHPLPFVLVGDVANAIVSCMTAPLAANKIYNVSGDISISARDYINEFNRISNRQVQFHPKSPRRLWLEDLAKCLIKKMGGRKTPMPSIRDFRSRAMYAQLNCTDLKSDTNWTPVTDRSVFFDAVFE